jgi:hypothetical protein
MQIKHLRQKQQRLPTFDAENCILTFGTQLQEVTAKCTTLQKDEILG